MEALVIEETKNDVPSKQQEVEVVDTVDKADKIDNKEKGDGVEVDSDDSLDDALEGMNNKLNLTFEEPKEPGDEDDAEVE